MNAIAPRESRQVLLPVVPVRIRAGGRSLETFALLDSGSEGTLLLREAADALGLKGHRQKVRFGTFHGEDPMVETRQVNFSIASLINSKEFSVSDAYVVPTLNVRRHRVALSFETIPYLRDLKIPVRSSQDVKLLIGMDVQDTHLYDDVRRPPIGSRGPNAILTPFGWSVVGRVTSGGSVVDRPLPQIHHVCFQQLETFVERFWRTDSFPVRDAPNTFIPADEKAALDQLRASICHTGVRYQVAVPKRIEAVSRLPDNRDAARRCFMSLERRLVRDESLNQAVTASMNENLSAGYAVKVDPALDGVKAWFLTYHPVKHPNKPEKVRLVFNAAARFKGVALNDSLLKGPDLTTQLLAVFLRFRERAVGVSADIAKMFYQVLVPPEDRSLFRFFWRRPGSNEPLDEYEMLVHIFGAVSSPTVCNFALQKLIEDAPDEYKHAAQRIRTDFYVDNLLTSFDCVKEGVEACSTLVKLLALGGFPLVQFSSSERQLLESFPAGSRASPELNLDLDKLPTERTLGYLWNLELDTLVFQFKSSPSADSKRSILSAVSSVYDPVGLLAPVVLVAKILLQDIWRLKTDWDDPLPLEVLSRWRRWTVALPTLEHLSVRRNHLTKPQSSYRSLQLHAFSDASKDGFGAVVYLRAEDDSCVDVSLVMAKARVAPIHQQTIPKLELQGALMASRLVEYCRKELTLPLASVFYWCDATTVLRWLNTSRMRFTPFVGNRVSEILETSQPDQWRHVPGVLNPADDCSRGLSSEELEVNVRWFAGPEFLQMPSQDWPAPFAGQLSLEASEEWVGCLTIAEDGPIDALMARVSNVYRLSRIAAWVNRFVRNVKRKVKKRPNMTVSNETTSSGTSSLLKLEEPLPWQQDAQELQKARFTLIRAAQRASFPDDVDRLMKQKSVRRESRLLQLDPFLDSSGLLRVGGRLTHAPRAFDARYSIVLETKHPLTRLFVRSAHIAVAHGRTERTLAEVRSRYWVLRGREAVKTVISSCFYCARQRTQPPQPMMAPLPRQRVQPFQHPFNCVGIDYFGPLTVTIGRRSEKRWGVIFTCLSTRAVHLELAASMDTDSFLMAFSRFVSRTGAPSELFSDNGTNLRTGESELKEAVGRLNEVRVAEQMARKEIR